MNFSSLACGVGCALGSDFFSSGVGCALESDFCSSGVGCVAGASAGFSTRARLHVGPADSSDSTSEFSCKRGRNEDGGEEGEDGGEEGEDGVRKE